MIHLISLKTYDPYGLERSFRSIETLNTWILTILFCCLGATLCCHGDESQSGITEISITSSIDGTDQKALYYKSNSPSPVPLILSLHSWSGDYNQADPLAEKVIAADWNYIHPDFRGANNNPDACLSEKAVQDLDDAIAYALREGPVDNTAVFVVGTSGGGYATLGSYLRTNHPVRLFLAWVPISDLDAWYRESKNRGKKYAEDIVACCSPFDEYDPHCALERSPLYWPMPVLPPGRIELYAGIEDGYTGSVPISHSLHFFNKLATHFQRPDARVSCEEMLALLTRDVKVDRAAGTLEDRSIFYKKEIAQASVTIFDGTHEMLTGYCFERICAAVEER
ncbi:MAG: prolyl oligopeptidase family serine peptidase [Candidatus Hydrogenedentes bacterium]|nr:prolyl oligopeptidase family serine peptidase [Candidatus Hydrogenedentota bacterium]